MAVCIRGGRRWLILLVALAVVSFAIVGSCLLRRQPPNLSEEDIAAVQQDRLRLLRKYWEPLCVVGPQGEQWFVPIARLTGDSRNCWRLVDGVRKETGPFAPARWEFVIHQAATTLPDGRPMVVWSGFDGTPGEKIVSTTLDGEDWSAPTVIATGVRVRCLDLLRDADGRIHLLYVSPLQPGESYGPIDGFYPYKSWHVCHENGAWGKPRPIQGRGRFDISQALLTLTPSGRMVASAEIVHQFNSGNRKLAVQVLGKGGWSDVRELDNK